MCKLVTGCCKVLCLRVHRPNTLHSLLCCCVAAPYVASSTGQLYERIREATPVQLPERPSVSEPLAALLRGLLDKDPSSRMTLAEVRQQGLICYLAMYSMCTAFTSWAMLCPSPPVMCW